MTRLRIFYRNINLEEFVYPKFYQIWSDKTNSLRKSEGKGIRGKCSGNQRDEKITRERSGISSGKNKLQQENVLLRLMKNLNTGDKQTRPRPLTNLPGRYAGSPYKQCVI
jgi:hypothetical protein